MREETREFIENWQKKLSTNTSNGLEAIYDKFTSLYTIYNRLYNEAYYQMRQAEVLDKSRYSDYEKATDIPLRFIGAEEISNRMRSENNLNELESICHLIENKVFHINLAEGEPKEEIDALLLENLRNEDKGIQARAVLSLIYNVRCNIVHGYKDFQEHQRLLVEPLTNLLSEMTNVFLAKFQ